MTKRNPPIVPTIDMPGANRNNVLFREFARFPFPIQLRHVVEAFKRASFKYPDARRNRHIIIGEVPEKELTILADIRTNTPPVRAALDRACYNFVIYEHNASGTDETHSQFMIGLLVELTMLMIPARIVDGVLVIPDVEVEEEEEGDDDFDSDEDYDDEP